MARISAVGFTKAAVTRAGRSRPIPVNRMPDMVTAIAPIWRVSFNLDFLPAP